MFIISAIIGLLWNKEKWWKTALIFWIPFTILYTTVFTNSDGFFTGTIGSLGYWIVQQGVSRGSQPWYYYLLVQIPIYEFLPALGFCLRWLGYKRKPAKLLRLTRKMKSFIGSKTRIRKNQTSRTHLVSWSGGA